MTGVQTCALPIYVHAVNKKKAKKVHRFLQYGRKKMIDVHTVNQKKQRNWDFCGDSLQWIYVYS